MTPQAEDPTPDLAGLVDAMVSATREAMGALAVGNVVAVWRGRPPLTPVAL